MAKQAKSRDDYAKECPAYGWTEEGGTGFDASTEECTACLGQEPEMAAACKAEAEAGQKAADDAQEAALKAEKEEDGKAATEKAERAAAEAAEKKARKEAAKTTTNTPAKKPEPVTTLAEPTAPPETPVETPTPPEPVQKVDKGPSAIDIIVEVLKRGKPCTSQDIQAEIVKKRGCARGTAAVYTGECLKFGLLMGTLIKDGKAYRLSQGK